MVRKHVLSVIFLALVSANVIQAGVIPLGLFDHETLPNFINLLDIPRMGEFATSTASAASQALGGVRSYVDNFRTGLGGLNLLSRFGLPLVNGGILPGLTNPGFVSGGTVVDGIVPSANLIRPGLFGGRLLGNYGIGRLFRRPLLGNYGVGGPTDAASAAAASSAAA